MYKNQVDYFLRSFFWVALFFVQHKAYSQVADSVLVEGIIHKNKESKFLLHTRDYFVVPQTYSVSINLNGAFSIKVPLLSSGNIEIIYNDTLLSLYIPKNKKLWLTWRGDDFFQSVRVDAKDPLNGFLIHYQQRFTDSSIAEFERAELESERKDYFKIVDSLSEQQFAFLKKHGSLLDAVSYQRVAYDIFYRNLYKIMNSSFMKGHSFAIKKNGEDVVAGFPFVTLQDKKFDSLMITSAIELKRQNPGIDSVLLKKYSFLQANQIFKSQFSIINHRTLELSKEYRNFLNDYFLNLSFEIYYRNLGKNQLNSIKDYSALVRAIINDEVIADWLIGQKIHGYILYNASRIEQPEFEQHLKNINSVSIKERLKITYKFYRSLQQGNPAPPFSVTNEKGEIVSLTQFKGKYVFINFWDSFCEPCIRDITSHSMPVAEKYKDSNVVFLYISLDFNEKVWKKSVAKYKPQGVNLHAKLGWNNVIVQQYGIWVTPRSVIIAPDGTIVDAQGPRLNELMMFNFFR